MEFETISHRLSIRGEVSFELHAFLERLLGGVVARLGQDCVGHAKALAYLPTGQLYASMTEQPSMVNFVPFGDVPTHITEATVDITCIFGNTSRQVLERAYHEALAQIQWSNLRIEHVQYPGAAGRSVHELDKRAP
jgi:hypothetical protein